MSIIFLSPAQVLYAAAVASHSCAEDLYAAIHNMFVPAAG